MAAIAKLVNMPAEDVYCLMCEGSGPHAAPALSHLRSICKHMSQQLHAGLPLLQQPSIELVQRTAICTVMLAAHSGLACFA